MLIPREIEIMGYIIQHQEYFAKPVNKLPKPNPQLINQWIKALESGEYQVIKGELVSEHGFCALGVLGDQLGFETIDIEVFQSKWASAVLEGKYVAAKALVEPTTFYELRHSLPQRVLPYGLQKIIHQLNDKGINNGYEGQEVFNTIAQYLRDYWLEEPADATHQ